MDLAPPFSDGNLAGVRVSRETLDRLVDYAESVVAWSRSISMVSSTDPSRLWQRHILDSAQLWPLQNRHTQTWVDLGSGAGLPGVVLAIIGHQLAPDIRFHLVESDQRKAAFLRFIESKQKLGLIIHAKRIEALAPLSAQTVTARALAPLPKLLGLVSRHLAVGGTALLPKGENVANELLQAAEKWHFISEQHPSKLDSRARILQISNIEKTGKPSA